MFFLFFKIRVVVFIFLLQFENNFSTKDIENIFMRRNANWVTREIPKAPLNYKVHF